MNGTRWRSAAIVAGSLGLILIANDGVRAADHNEAPGTMADPAADIADFYAWHTNTSLVTALTFAGLGAGGEPATYDPDVVYAIHLDNDGDDVSDIDVECCFAEVESSWYVFCRNVPGADSGGQVWGPVDTVLDGGGGARVFAGLREDPFFMDLDGFVDTLASGTLSFDPSNDTFAGTNVTAIVVEVDRDLAANATNTLQTWATTARRDP